MKKNKKTKWGNRMKKVVDVILCNAKCIYFFYVADATRRAITYKMSKNKGLTPHRKKEQRNPRVKHKLKYRKALIRRKGAVSRNI